MARPKSIKATPLQQETLDMIRRHIRRHGFPPTIQEMATTFGISPASCHDRVNQLVEKGYLKRTPGKSRGLAVVDRGRSDGQPAGRPLGVRAKREGKSSRRILLAAEKLFGQNGPDAVGMRRVAKEAGVSVQSLTYHFGTKRSLTRKAMEHALTERIPYDAIFAPGEAADTFSPQELADALAAMMIRLFEEMRNPDFVPYARLIVTGLVTDDPETQLLLANHFDRLFEFRFLAVLARGNVHLAPGPQTMFLLNYLWSQVLFYACSRDLILQDFQMDELPADFTDMVGMFIAQTLCHLLRLPQPTLPGPF